MDYVESSLVSGEILQEAALKSDSKISKGMAKENGNERGRGLERHSEEGMACGKTLRQERAWEFESKEVQCGWSTGSKGKRLGKESESTG